MSKFFNGQGRDADFEYGGGVHFPTPVERVLNFAGIKGQDAVETAHGINTLMDRMTKDGAPMSAKLKMIDNFVSPLMQGQPRENIVSVVNECFDAAQPAKPAAPAVPAAETKSTVTIKHTQKNIP